MKNTVFAALCAGLCLCFHLVEPGSTRALEKRFTNSIGMEFALIPADSFMMGCENASDKDCENDEKPRRKVTITKPFYMGVTEVTQAQWERVMGDNPSKFKGENRPVESVSWFDAHKFIERLNKMEGGQRYRLPSEAEWEYAVRAGSTAKYSFGNDAGQLGRHAWYTENSGSETHRVAQKQPNAWGLYDMHGNVWEWVWDRYNEEYYDFGSDTDPLGPDAGEYRVLRGGSWLGNAWGCRSANRYGNSPDDRYDIYGFRLAMTAE